MAVLEKQLSPFHRSGLRIQNPCDIITTDTYLSQKKSFEDIVFFSCLMQSSNWDLKATNITLLRFKILIVASFVVMKELLCRLFPIICSVHYNYLPGLFLLELCVKWLLLVDRWGGNTSMSVSEIALHIYPNLLWCIVKEYVIWSSL